MSKIPLRRLQASILALALIVFLSISQSLFGGHILQALQIVGGLIIVLGVLIRILSSVYIAGHKNTRLIIQGPYSISRNPLYVAWLCGAIGIGLAVGSLILAALLGAAIFLIYDKAILIEEKRLSSRFPKEFKDYMDATPRWLGQSRKIDFHLSHSPNLSPLFKAVLEGACLFLIYPLRFLTTSAQNDGLLPLLLHYL